jgi:hypothetical protein
MNMKVHLDTVIPLLHKTPYGVLATQSTQLPGYPFASILPFILDERQRPVFLISALAEHTKNLLADHRASFLVSSPNGHNVLTGARLTSVGDVQRFDASEQLLARYLRYQPDARQYLDLGDFALFRLTPKRARYVAGFGEMGWLEEAEWAQGTILPLVDEAKFCCELVEVLPIGIRLLGLDCYGFDIERQGKRERLQFPNAPVAAENVGDVIKRFLTAL